MQHRFNLPYPNSNWCHCDSLQFALCVYFINGIVLMLNWRSDACSKLFAVRQILWGTAGTLYYLLYKNDSVRVSDAITREWLNWFLWFCICVDIFLICPNPLQKSDNRKMHYLLTRERRDLLILYLFCSYWSPNFHFLVSEISHKNIKIFHFGWCAWRQNNHSDGSHYHPVIGNKFFTLKVKPQIHRRIKGTESCLLCKLPQCIKNWAIKAQNVTVKTMP